jgi:mRNA interferase YafQ
MRTINPAGRFKRDYKRVMSGPSSAKLDDVLRAVFAMLIADQPLPERFHDHVLAGEWKGYRDCYIRPDLILIYRMPDVENLEVVRLGSHSELGL